MASLVEQARPHRAIRCWACEELLALVSCDGRVIVEADADTTIAGGGPVSSCPCDASTIIPGNWEVDER
jgi:hypothetical protein